MQALTPARTSATVPSRVVIDLKQRGPRRRRKPAVRRSPPRAATETRPGRMLGPPFTWIEMTAMKGAAGEARNATEAATSGTSPLRPSATRGVRKSLKGPSAGLTSVGLAGVDGDPALVAGT